VPYDCVVASISSWIAHHRQRLGLHQGDLAEKVGVGQQAVSAWERNKSEPTDEVLAQLAELFGDAPPQRRHLRALADEEDEVDGPSDVFTRERFALEILEPRLQAGALTGDEVQFLRDVALSVYGFNLGGSPAPSRAPSDQDDADVGADSGQS
jgi:transcriptional regulator with XRE-family HTH domain